MVLGVSWVPHIYIFYCKSWFLSPCLYKEASGYLGIPLKGKLFKQKWIVPSCATHWKLDYCPHLSLLSGYQFPSESESWFLYIHVKLRAKCFWAILLHLKHFVMCCSPFSVYEVSSSGDSHHTCLGCGTVNSVCIAYLNKTIHLGQFQQLCWITQNTFNTEYQPRDGRKKGMLLLQFTLIWPKCWELGWF